MKYFQWLFFLPTSQDLQHHSAIHYSLMQQTEIIPLLDADMSILWCNLQCFALGEAEKNSSSGKLGSFPGSTEIEATDAAQIIVTVGGHEFQQWHNL